jgi:hypothetical protein
LKIARDGSISSRGLPFDRVSHGNTHSIASADSAFGNLEKPDMGTEWTAGSALSSLQVASLQIENPALDLEMAE